MFIFILDQTYLQLLHPIFLPTGNANVRPYISVTWNANVRPYISVPSDCCSVSHLTWNWIVHFKQPIQNPCRLTLTHLHCQNEGVNPTMSPSFSDIHSMTTHNWQISVVSLIRPKLPWTSRFKFSELVMIMHPTCEHMYVTENSYPRLVEGWKVYTHFPLLTARRSLHNKDHNMWIPKKSHSPLVTNTALFTLATWLTVPPNVPSNEKFFS